MTHVFLAYTPPAGSSLGFDVLQLRSTSLVRWEFRPGSTLFAVWTHGRDGSTRRSTAIARSAPSTAISLRCIRQYVPAQSGVLD